MKYDQRISVMVMLGVLGSASATYAQTTGSAMVAVPPPVVRC